ncbi:DUF4231 domain-containing protein [Limibacter armeniacum]|uniref:DUF4231 domain-containing protein n=1 Tax=Limibacter armeniacum TaxID=466084 RepID=UPI002FE64BB4
MSTEKQKILNAETNSPDIKRTHEESIEHDTEVNISEASYKREQYEGAAKNMQPLSRQAPLLTDDIYINERLDGPDGQITYFDRKSTFHKNRYELLKKIEFLIASSVPVIITFSTSSFTDQPIFGDDNFKISTMLQILATIGGVIVVIMNKLLELGEHHKLWKEYRATAEALNQEKYLYMTKTEPYDEDDAFPKFVEKIENLLNMENQKWRISQAGSTKKQSVNTQWSQGVKDITREKEEIFHNQQKRLN